MSWLNIQLLVLPFIIRVIFSPVCTNIIITTILFVPSQKEAYQDITSSEKIVYIEAMTLFFRHVTLKPSKIQKMMLIHTFHTINKERKKGAKKERNSLLLLYSLSLFSVTVCMTQLPNFHFISVTLTNDLTGGSR